MCTLFILFSYIPHTDKISLKSVQPLRRSSVTNVQKNYIHKEDKWTPCETCTYTSEYSTILLINNCTCWRSARWNTSGQHSRHPNLLLLAVKRIYNCNLHSNKSTQEVFIYLQVSSRVLRKLIYLGVKTFDKILANNRYCVLCLSTKQHIFPYDSKKLAYIKTGSIDNEIHSLNYMFAFTRSKIKSHTA